MAVQITIIGLGQVGASMGLALAKIKDQVVRIGNDRDPDVARKAERTGAIDKFVINLPSAVEKADVVILAVPADEVRETIEVIAQDLKPGVVLIDTSPVKGPVMAWAKELLPGEDRYFAALTPGFNPAYLLEAYGGIDHAHADLFEKSLMLVSTQSGIDDSAVELVTRLIAVFGATPLFADTYEADGLTAYSHTLPNLLAAAMVNATIDQPGWREARKMAGPAYAQVTGPVEQFDETQKLGTAALLNAENTVRMLDNLMDALAQLRDALAEKDEAALHERLAHARDGREMWLQERSTGNWEKRAGSDQHMPTSGETIGRLFGGKMFGGQQKKDK